MTIIRYLLAAAALAPLADADAQSDPVVESRAHYRTAVQAYEAKDYSAYLEHARQAQALRPEHGGVTYALASALALTGDTAGALTVLNRFAAMGYSADITADSDFASLRKTAGYAKVLRRLQHNREPVVAGRVAFELTGSEQLIEGIAYDPSDDVFYLSSVHQAKLFRVTRQGVVTEFAPGGMAGWAAMGLKVDAKRRALWVASSAVPQTTGYNPADSGRSAILRYDLRTGRLDRRCLAPADGVGHTIGDLVVSKAGDVYASDSRAPVIYRVAAQGDTLEKFIESPLLLSAQGLTLTPDERTLYLADYARGLLRVDLPSHSVSLMETADGVVALGIDGLYFYQGSLVGIQNGLEPHRLARFTLDRSGKRVVRAQVLEQGHPRHNEPTLGVVVGNELFYVANSQWGLFGEDGKVAKPEALKPTTVLRLRL